MPERDPRIDPRPGDVLRKKYQGRLFEARSYIERQVDEVYDAPVAGSARRKRNWRVVYVGDNVCAPEISIHSWRKWAREAEVITRGGL